MKKLTIILLTVLGIFSSCKKDDKQTPEYEVTYTFTSTAKSYYVQIWDVTEQNNFADSVYTPSFSKTIKYDYVGTHRCKLSNANSKATPKSISISYDGNTNIQYDTLYPSMDSFITN